MPASAGHHQSLGQDQSPQMEPALTMTWITDLQAMNEDTSAAYSTELPCSVSAVLGTLQTKNLWLERWCNLSKFTWLKKDKQGLEFKISSLTQMAS
jgi:hypothetical protein